LSSAEKGGRVLQIYLGSKKLETRLPLKILPPTLSALDKLPLSLDCGRILWTARYSLNHIKTNFQIKKRNSNAAIFNESKEMSDTEEEIYSVIVN